MKVIIILVAIFLSGCSYRSAYDGMQASNRFECTKRPPSQYDECMENANKSYHQYKRERKQTIDQSDDNL